MLVAQWAQGLSVGVHPRDLVERRLAMPIPNRRAAVVVKKKKPRRVYVPPAVVGELKLETRAGSALGGDPWLDPLSGLLLNGGER